MIRWWEILAAGVGVVLSEVFVNPWLLDDKPEGAKIEGVAVLAVTLLIIVVFRALSHKDS